MNRSGQLWFGGTQTPNRRHSRFGRDVTTFGPLARHAASTWREHYSNPVSDRNRNDCVAYAAYWAAVADAWERGA